MTILIATNEPILAIGLETVLNAGGLKVAGVCNDVFELFERLQSCLPEIVVLDMPLLPAPEVIHDLQRLAPQCQFVLWPRLTSANSPAQVVEAVQLMAELRRTDPSPSTLVNRACSGSERELIALAGYGLNNEEIAAALGSDRATVQKLVRGLSDRIGAEDRYELALYGLSTLKETDQDKRSI